MSSSYCKFVSIADAQAFSRVMVPADEETEAQFNSAPLNKSYQVKFQREMNRRFKRKVERVLRDLYENQERYEAEDVHRAAVKMAIGWVFDEPVIRGGETCWVTKPLDFYNCKQADLEAFWELLQTYALELLGHDWMRQYQ